jgi:membrane dipeptidase
LAADNSGVIGPAAVVVKRDRRLSHTSLDARDGKNPRMAKMMAPRLISKDHARVIADAGGVIA